MPTLYQRLLGDDFGKLPMVLQRFHGSSLGAKGTGHFKVERPFSKTLQRLADQYRLPIEADSALVELEIKPDGERERWLRSIGKKHFQTTQWLEGADLVEQVALSRLRFKVEADERGMSFIQVGRAGLPLPRALTPTVSANVTASEESFYVSVTVSLAGMGMLVHYEGEITPC